MRRVVLAVMLILGPLAASCTGQGVPVHTRTPATGSTAGSTTGPASPAIFSEEQEKVLVAKAEEMAFYNGEPTPTSVQVVLTTVQALIDIGEMEPGDLPADTSVYFVQMTGDFVGNMAKPPEGENLPTGHMLYFVMEADTLDLLGWGIGEPTWELESLGEPVTLDVPVPISLESSTRSP